MSNNKGAGGRPTKYKPEYARMAAKACELGATDKDLSELFQVALSTIHLWKLEHPKFSDSLKASKAAADLRVERALYERATGYSHPEDKVFNNNGEPMVVPTTKHYAPDTGACVVWLANRQPDKWKKDPTSDSKPPQDINIQIVNPYGSDNAN